MNATVAFATADETIRLGTGSVAFEAESRDDLFFGKSENRPPNKNFYGYQAFLMKGGWVLRWDGHARLRSNYNALKDRFRKM